MRCFKFGLLLLVLGAFALAHADGENSDSNNITSTTTQDETTVSSEQTTLPSNQTTSTSKQTTLPSNQTTSTSKPTTSTSKPTKSTSKPTPTSGSTTSAPDETYSESQNGFWNVSDSKVTCILLKMSACFKIKFEAMKSDKMARMCLPKDAKVGPESHCGNNTNTIQLVFGPHSFTMVFAKASGKKDHVESGELSYKLTPEIFKDAKDKNQYRHTNFTDKKFFESELESSYKCEHEETVKLDNDVSMVVKNLEAQAFRKKSDNEFSNPAICKADQKLDYLLPIICSIVLGSLVAIILMIYCIARFRVSRRTYDDIKS